MIIKKMFVIINILLISIFSLTACSNKDTNGDGAGEVINKEETKNDKDKLIMAIGSEPDEGFDPIYGWGRYGSPLIQSSLVKTNKDMEVVSDLSHTYNISDDGLKWTFNLRDDAKFTDGQAVTAKDVVFTFKTAKESNSVVDLTVLDKVKELDEYTVEMTLLRPESSFIYSVAKTGIVPEHAYNSSYGDNPLGSGPFKFIRWDKGQQLILESNEDYYGDIPEIKNIVILFMTEDAAIVAAKAGQLDVAMTVPNLASVEIKGMSIYTAQTIDNRGITLPVVSDQGLTNKDGYPIGNDVTSDIAIRKALSYGLDRQQMVDDVLNGYGKIAYSEADGMPWFNEDIAIEYDLDKAKDLLEEANWLVNKEGIREKEGLKAEFTIIYPAGDSIRQGLAMNVSSQGKGLGIKINVEGLSWDEIDKRMYKDPVLMGWGDQTPMESYLLYHSSNKGLDYYNPENYDNEIVDKYMEEALKTTDVKEANKLWKKAQWDGSTGTSTLGDAPWVWLVNIDHIYYVRDGLDIGEQKIHPHGHAWPLVSNLEEWRWAD